MDMKYRKVVDLLSIFVEMLWKFGLNNDETVTQNLKMSKFKKISEL